MQEPISLSDYANDMESWREIGCDEETSMTAVNLEDTCQQLKHLVEDKDIAARAVAFVVNSTRKGIVPLCSDVAHLLRMKQKLENRVRKLKFENESLRSNHGDSSLSSLMPTSLRSSSTQHAHSDSVCSRCSSHCSSSIQSNSPKQIGRPSRLHRTRACAEVLCAGLAEQAPDSGLGPGDLPEEADFEETELDRPSLETVNEESQTDLLLCFPDGATGIEAQFKETLKLNARLAEELGAAKKEIELLRGRLKEVEMQQLARQYLEAEDGAAPTQSLYKPVASRREEVGPKGFMKLHMTSSMFFPSPMEGCLCTQCNNQCNASKMKLKYASTFDNKGQQVPIQLSDYVVAKGDMMGHVRYIGHIDKLGHTNMVFVGLELDAPVGQNDGTLEGKTYFSCRLGHGSFVPVQDIVCIVYKKPNNHPKCSIRKSSDSDSSEYCRPSYQRRKPRHKERRSTSQSNPPLTLPKNAECADSCL